MNVKDINKFMFKKSSLYTLRHFSMRMDRGYLYSNSTKLNNVVVYFTYNEENTF